MAGLRKRIAAAWATLMGAPNGPVRMYESARASRLSGDWGASTDSSADSELASSLTQLRARSRALCRDVSYAKRAKTLVVNNVIGSGMGMQAQVYTTRDELNARVNDDIEEQWRRWSVANRCHTGGRLSFSSLERLLFAEIFEAGEVIVRKHLRPFGDSSVPFALEVIEAERIADDYSVPALIARNGNEVRLGVEVDSFHRPIAYYLRRRHPSELHFLSKSPDEIERVPADQIIHLALIDRWPQTRGEPWMASSIRTFRDMHGYVEAEITRARVQASTPWTIETPEDSASFGEEQADGSVEMTVEPGVAKRLNPGEKMNAPGTNSPNPNVESFMRYLLQNVTAGTNTNYASLSGDYSQSNYSSSRLALLDDRDMWRALQSWFICTFREPIHKEWMQLAVLSGAIKSIGVESYALDREKFNAVRFRPRGWGWVDPTKEVQAFKDAVRSGFMTMQDVIATSGADFDELVEQRKKEVALTEAAELVFDTDPKQVSNAGLTQARPVGTTIPLDQDEAVELANKKPEPPPEASETDDESTDEPANRRVFSFKR